MKTITKLWLLIAILIILTPIGLIIPAYFKARGAFGEEKISDVWKAPFSDYCVKGLGENAGYIVSAAVGIIITVGIVYLAGKILSYHNNRRG